MNGVWSVWMLAFSLSAHECAHGAAALSQGDDTAQKAGRITLNPLKHLDPVRSVVIPLVLFALGLPILGGAKPLPVEPANFRHGARSDVIVSLAGIGANLALAGVCWVCLQWAPGPVFAFGLVLNLMLAGFNALPLPPLDGSRVLKYALPVSWRAQYERLGALVFVLVTVALVVLVVLARR